MDEIKKDEETKNEEQAIEELQEKLRRLSVRTEVTGGSQGPNFTTGAWY